MKTIEQVYPYSARHSTEQQEPERIPLFDRTGTLPTVNYDLTGECQIFEAGDYPKTTYQVVMPLKAPPAADPETVRIAAEVQDGLVLLWGEDEAGSLTWIRRDDEVARNWAADPDMAHLLSGRVPAHMLKED